MKKILVLNHEIFCLYWMNNVQFRTPDKEKVKDYINQHIDRGHRKDEFTIKSNFFTEAGQQYNVQDFLKNVLTWN